MSFSLLYRRTLVVLCVAGFYTGLLNYLFLTKLLPVRPALWIVALLGLSLPLLRSRHAWRLILATPLTVWCGLTRP